jgi:hypothetical protein
MQIQLFKVKSAGFFDGHLKNIEPHYSAELSEKEGIYFFKSTITLHEFPFNLFHILFSGQTNVLLTLFRINRRRDGTGVWAGEVELQNYRYFAKIETMFDAYATDAELEAYLLEVRVNDLHP